MKLPFDTLAFMWWDGERDRLGVPTAAPPLAHAADEPFDVADVFRDLSRTGQLAGHEVRGRFYEIGSHAGLAELDRYLRQS